MQWKFIWGLLIFFSLFSKLSNSQSIESYLISSGGDVLNSNNLNIEFAVGEISTEYLTNSNFQLQQGFFHPFLQSTGVNNNIATNLLLRIYPNPTTNYVIIETEKFENNYEVFLYDIFGKLLLKEIITSNEFKLDLSEYRSGTYCMKFLSDNSAKSTFIQKIKY